MGPITVNGCLSEPLMTRRIGFYGASPSSIFDKAWRSQCPGFAKGDAMSILLLVICMTRIESA